MKREEKNQMTRRRIMDSALAEFAEKGYGGSSINAICASPDISKGIVYHYFETKDDLYLSCVEECFKTLTKYLAENVETGKGCIEDELEQYFRLRMEFFRLHPKYLRIFSDALISPPAHLLDQIRERKKDFDEMNIRMLDVLLSKVSLRAPYTKEEAIDTFRQFQDYINVCTQQSSFEKREESCRRALSILLYGVIER